MSSAASVTAPAALSLSAVACGATESSADSSPSSHGTIRDAVDETLDTRTAIAEVNAFMRALFPSMAYDKADRPYPPPDEVPIDVCVGDEGWVRKIVYEFPEFDLFAGDLTTMELYDLGADLEIEPPSASEIVNG
jgi:hypothetical protein